MDIFKAYDIRGIYGFDLTENFSYNLGMAVVTFSKPKSIVVGYDSRKSSMKLFSAFASAIIDSGADVIHVGMVSRPMLNWIVLKHGYDLGVIISASHNPKEYNGYKFIAKNGMPLYYDNYLIHIEQLIKGMKGGNFVKPKKKGRIISLDYIDDYVKFLSSNLSNEFIKHSKNKRVKIVGDASNGAAGEIIKRFLDINNLDYELLFSEPDGNFPCHSPNPLDKNAPVVLSNTVVKNKAEFGFIVDPDADRIRFVDEKGNVLDNNYSACIVAKYLLEKDRKKFVVHDLVSKKILGEVIRRNKGKEIISRVGYGFIFENMKKNDAIFGAEVSGHYFFRSMNYLDSGLLMLVNMLNALYKKSNKGKRLSTLIKPLNKYVDTGEINYPVADQGYKQEIIGKIVAYFKNNKKILGIKKILLLDGVSIYFADAWVNVRPSNTESFIRMHAEARNAKKLVRIKKIMDKLITK
jgi:phosphomannomutase